MTPPSIAITGASGAVGRRTATRLAAEGVVPRLVVRDPSRAPELPDAQVRTASSYGAAEEMVAALEGVDTLFLIPAAEAPDRVDQHRTAVNAAVAAGVRRLVYLSFLGAEPGSTFTLARDHAATEQHIRATDLDWTFLRMSLYLDFLPAMVGADGVIRGPAGEGHVAPILRDDVAASAVAVLTAGDHRGETYDLTGRERLTLGEAADQMARISGKPIRFHDETIEEAFASRSGYGAPDWEVAGWVSSYVGIASGELDVVSDTVRRLTGREPGTLAEDLRAHPDRLDHVTAGA